MKEIGFIGAYDKINLILFVAKVITTFDKKVLIIDATSNQKARYIVPTVNPSSSYITNFENIDVSVGLYSMDNVCHYLGVNDKSQLKYDYVLIDMDHPNMFSRFKISPDNLNYFVTAFDMFSLKKGIEILSGIPIPLNLTKILFSNNTLEEDDEYLNYLTLGLRVQWAEQRVYFPLDNLDRERIIENEKSQSITLKNISKEYKNALAFITKTILECTDGEVKKAIKLLE